MTHAWNDMTPAKQKNAIIIGTALVALIAIAVILLSTPKQQTWHRPAAASVTYTVLRGQDLATIGDIHGRVPGLMLAAFNDRELGAHFNDSCTGKNWPRPGAYYCNTRLNIAQASTLDPGQNLRIPDVSAIPADINRTVERIGRTTHAAILVDGGPGRQKNLDTAVQYNLALDRQGKTLAPIWIYTRTGMVEYRNESGLWRFNVKWPGLPGALHALETQPIDLIVLVTDSLDPNLLPLTSTTPVIGFCQSSGCQPQMAKMVKVFNKADRQKGSWVVPFTG
ncbi:MAG: hypothetical protein JWL82_200 [Parcubacteria group bacterium]|nr:hypothetical protein [Parcubacteria group bacterium]